MSGDIELPFTRRHMVEAGFGHHSAGAANTDSGGISARSILSPGEPGVPACTGRRGMAMRLAFFSECFAAACMNEAHIRNSAFGKVSMSPRQYTHPIGQTKTCALPEKPAERVVCQISQTNIRLTRRFSRSALPARNRHRGDPQLASEVRLA